MTTPIGRAISRRGRDRLAIERTRPVSNDLIDLSGDELEGTTTDRVRADTIAALAQHRGDHYTRRPGMLSLCQAVTDSLAKDNLSVDAENGVLITGSVQEARFIGLRAVATDKTIYLPQASYLSDYAPAARFANTQTEYFDPAGPLPQLHEGIPILPNPNPATGQCYPREMLERFAHWAADRDLFVISDETLAPLCRSGFPMLHVAALPGMTERTLTLGSFAGIPGLDAWQVSWLAGPNSLVSPARGLKLAITLCSAAVSQHAALAGLSSGSARLAARDDSRVNALKALLEEHHIPYLEPHTVAFVVADVRALGGGDVVAEASARGGVRVTSGSEFGDPNLIRITAASTFFEQGLARLNSILAMLEKGS